MAKKKLLPRFLRQQIFATYIPVLLTPQIYENHIFLVVISDRIVNHA